MSLAKPKSTQQWALCLARFVFRARSEHVNGIVDHAFEMHQSRVTLDLYRNRSARGVCFEERVKELLARAGGRRETRHAVGYAYKGSPLLLIRQ
jgi:hypothetical protein